MRRPPVPRPRPFVGADDPVGPPSLVLLCHSERSEESPSHTLQETKIIAPCRRGYASRTFCEKVPKRGGIARPPHPRRRSGRCRPIVLLTSFQLLIPCQLLLCLSSSGRDRPNSHPSACHLSSARYILGHSNLPLLHTVGSVPSIRLLGTVRL